MVETALKGLLIRTAIAVRPGAGYVYACDPVRDEDENPHTIIFRYAEGSFSRFECNYNAHTACIIEQPEYGLLNASEQGYCTLETRSGVIGADIIDSSQPAPKKPRRGGIRSVSKIGGKAYAVGLRGMVYRLDRIMRWTRIDDGLPDTFDIQAIHGFGSSDLYAVGRSGNLWQYDGREWTKRELPTNVNLTAVTCTGNGKVYVAGHGGLLIRGRQDRWTIIEHEETKDDIWDIEWFEGQVFASTMRSVYRVDEDTLQPVDFGEDRPKSCYQLSTAKGIMWSNGERDVMSFDGKNWRRIV